MTTNHSVSRTTDYLNPSEISGSLQFVPSLDGIRGIAVLLVVFYHGGYTNFGWIGVQMFFVLSGFLITRILLQDKNKLNLRGYLKRFYIRRTLRVFPLYFGYLCIFALACIYFGKFKLLEAHFLSLLTYTYNLARLVPSEEVSLYYTHFWSLAIEEQFYLVWPLIVYFSSERTLKKVVLTLLVAAPLLRYISVELLQTIKNDPLWHGRFLYTFTLTQADAFAWGAALCLFDLRKNLKLYFMLAFGMLSITSILNLAFIDLPSYLLKITSLGYPPPEYLTTRNFQHVWGYTIISFCSSMAIAYCLQGKLRFLENRFLTWIGKISYGIYLFHLPLLKLSLIDWKINQIYTPTAIILFACYLGVVILLSSLSYRYYESFFLGLKNRYSL